MILGVDPAKGRVGAGLETRPYAKKLQLPGPAFRRLCSADAAERTHAAPAAAPRKATRWRGFDYATTGAYFVTICAERRRCLFGRIANDAMIANALGRAVEQVWAELPGHYAGVELDAFVLMPNHVHGIIVLQPANAQAPTSNVAAQALPEIVRAFKSFSARAVNRLRGAVGRPVWQRGFHDRIVRNERELERIRDYVANNPHAWAFDAENPDRRR